MPVHAKVMVVGDVHGQYFDLLNILKRWRPDRNLLFLGDYVGGFVGQSNQIKPNQIKVRSSQVKSQVIQDGQAPHFP